MYLHTDTSIYIPYLRAEAYGAFIERAVRAGHVLLLAVVVAAQAELAIHVIAPALDRCIVEQRTDILDEATSWTIRLPWTRAASSPAKASFGAGVAAATAMDRS